MVKYNGIITYYEFKNDISYYTLVSIKKTLKHHQCKVGVGRKSELWEKVLKCIDQKNMEMLDEIPNIVKLQSHIRKWNVKHQYKICCLNQTVTNNLNNDSDFLTCNNWKKEIIYFFSYKDESKYYYFDIRSLYKLIQTDNKNPYTRNVIPNNVMQNIHKRINYLKACGVPIIIEDDEELNNNTPAGLKRSIMDIFIDLSSNGFTANPEWFIDMGIYKLKILYRQLEDIWNFRTELSTLNKIKIAPPDGRLFIIRHKNIISINDKYTLQQILVRNIKRLVLDGETSSDRKLGMMYFIIGLSEVSSECIAANSWVSITNSI